MNVGIGAVEASQSVCVFMPSPLLTITIESFGDGEEQHHIHAGGQGFWVARMIRQLGEAVWLAAPLGGDTGAMLRHLIEREKVGLCATEVSAENGSYIHDRRGGQRQIVSEVQSGPLSRHDLDDFYDTTLLRVLDSSVLVLAGPSTVGVVPGRTYTRLARDARENGVRVVADLSGETLTAALEGGIDLLKVSHQELIDLGMLRDTSTPAIIAVARELARAGADNVVISRADEPAIAMLDGELWEVRGPRLEPQEHRGAGDSMTAGLAVGLARGFSLLDAVRLGAGAGSLNVTRHGLGTGNREHVEQLARHVEIEPLRTAGAA